MLKLLSAILAALMLVSACSDNEAVRLRYQAEKDLYQLDRKMRDIRQAGEIDSTVIRQLAADYRQLSDFCAEATVSIDAEQYPVENRELSHLTFRSFIRLSQLYFNTRQYDSCTSQLGRLLSTVKLVGHEQAVARMNLGQALQAGGNLDSAAAVFDRITDDFYPPIDDTGAVLLDLFNLPLHTYRLAGYVFDSTARAERYSKTESYYRKVVEDYPETKLEMTGRSNLARLYENNGEWEKTIAELEALNKMTETDNKIIRVKIADILTTRLKKYDTALALYGHILETIPQQDSLDYALILFKTAIVKMEQKKYTEARELVVDVRQKYAVFFARTPLAQLTIARSFEFEGNWNRAEVEYGFLIEQYATSDEALASFLHIADYYRAKNRPTLVDKWLNDAEQHYEQMEIRGAGSQLGAKALIFKADLYERKEQPEKSARVLMELFDRYPQTEPGRRGLLSAARIFRDRLGDQATADSLVQVLKTSLTQPIGKFEI